MKNATKSLNELKNDFDRLCPQMNNEVKAFVSILFQMFEILINSLANRPDSRNSNMAPSQDPFRTKKKKKPNGRKPGGQPGHPESSISLDPNPDKIIKRSAKDCGPGQ